ncbi:MAG: sulfurtransferase complex subunit TusC [Moraxellaceae bacterium]
MKKTLYIQHHAPFASESPQEQLDALLVCAAFGQQVSVLFQDEGVWQLLPAQSGRPLQKRTLAAQLQALELYEVKALYADAASLQARGLAPEDLALPVTVLDAQGLQALLNQQDFLLRF